MAFESKKALLEYLGKNPKDNKLIDRMMVRGEVYMEDGMYYLVDKDALIDELREKIKELENSEPKPVADGDLEEAKAQWNYWEKKCRRYGKYIEQVIEVTYNRIKPMLGSKLEEKSEFREHILEEVREICGNDE